MRQRMVRALQRAQYAAVGAALGAFLGGLLSRSGASTGAATGAAVGAIVGEKRYDLDSIIEEVRERDEPVEASEGRLSRLRGATPEGDG